MRHARLVLVPILLLSAVACSDDESKPADTGGDPDVTGDADGTPDTEDDSPPDLVPDTVVDGGDAGDVDRDVVFTYEGDYAEATEAAVDTTFDVEGLRYPVHIRIDEYGIPHVLAQSWDDAFFAQGFLHARDRFPQMELFRHATSGRLARLAGGLDPSVVEDDIFVRMMGFARVGRAIYDALSEDSSEKRAADAYAAGVNYQIARIREGTANIPGNQFVAVNPLTVLDWEPWDGFSIIRFQQFDLSFDADTELRRTAQRLAAAEAFPAESETPAIAARAGLLSDLQRFQNPDPTYQIPGFGEETKASASPAGAIPWRAPHLSTVQRALSTLEAFPRSSLTPRPWQGGSSNSWAVGPDRSATGHAMIANDPHLGLSSPATFHQIHLVVEPRTEADGPALNVYGVMFPGLPGILIGHNEHVAWALTTASYDYTDAFVETLVHNEGETYPRVMHDDEEVELEAIPEVIEVGLRGEVASTVSFDVLWVPHRQGPIMLEIADGEPVYPDGDEAISFAWRGFTPSNEVSAILAWATAESIDDIRDGGLDEWVIGTQNLVFADTEGNIFTTGSSYIPVRPAAALDWDPQSNPTGNAPWWTLDGSGPMDWLDDPLDLALVPNVLNPAEGFIVTANNDQTGVTDDNNPLNDYAYIGYDYALGFRAGRIRRLLDGGAGVFQADHDFTLADLGTVQTDVYSGFGERLTPLLVAAADRLHEEYDNASSHPDLTALVAAHPDDALRVEAMRELLAAWSYTAEDGINGSPTADQVRDANATALFNVWAGELADLAFNDELAAVPGLGLGSAERARALLWLLEHPDEAATFDDTTEEPALWDDLTTEGVIESQNAIIMAAFFQADARLTALFESSDPDDWLWGALHFRVFSAQVPDTSVLGGGVSPYRWPQPGEIPYEGFPQPGDNWNVDRCDGGLGGDDFRCGGGPVMRYLVELDPDGVRTLNQLPGGQVHDDSSPHFRDLLDDYWLPRQWYEVPFHPDQVRDVTGEHVLLQ